MVEDLNVQNNHISPFNFRKLIQVVKDFKVARLEVNSNQ